MAQLYVLFEHAVGYCLFRVKEFEEIGSFIPQVEKAVSDSSKFQKVVQLVGFRAFKNAATALENINAVSEGILTETLSAFLQTNMPKSGKKNITLGVCDPKLGAAINEALQITVSHIGAVPELLRGIRFHLTHFVKGLNAASMKQSELGLGHSYSRGKVKFNVHRVDNMIIQSIALVDQLDKDVNTFSMRIREWYSYHFPELAKVVTDNYQYALCAHYIKNRTSLSEDSLEPLTEITMDSAKSQAILDAARMSMGMDISPIDLLNIEIFAKRVSSLAEYRKKLAEYLKSKMAAVAPNLSVLIGEVVGARLISKAGSLTSLAKYPASTVQILGAEKALFRALKARSNTPKYGLIYHSTYISRANTANKGRISRYLANKCSLASRIDCFSETLTDVFGTKLKEQVEERLKFYEMGELPRKNVDVMEMANDENKGAVKKILKAEKKKRKSSQLQDEHQNETPLKKKKKKKNEENEDNGILNSSKSGLNGDSTIDMDSSAFEDSITGEEKPKKKKKRQVTEEEGSTQDSSFLNSTVGSTSGEESVKKKKKKNKQ